jgi:serine/threonine protein kinase
MTQYGDSRLVQYRRGQARYVPVARLAAGGMAEVWKGEAHFADGHVEEVAIKRVLPMLASNPVYRRMLEDEARIGKLLRHRNIVRVFDAREVRGTYIMVMELVHGASLRELNGRLIPRNMYVPFAGALHMAREVARALEYAHEALDDMGRELDIVHRDVSPHNVLLDVNGRVKLMDFGLANSSANLAHLSELADTRASTRDPAMIGGKFGYLSPELVVRQESTRLLDLFALGVMLWESVTGRRLFQGSDDADTVRKVARCEVPLASSVNPDVSPELDQLLMGLLARRPAERYQSAREVGVDLDQLLAREPVKAGPAELATLIRTLKGMPRSAATQTQTGTFSSSHTASHIAPSPLGSRGVPDRLRGHPTAWATRPITLSGTQERAPRLNDSFVDELDALSELPVPSAFPPPRR